jgi:hypothetical protein
LQGKKKKSISTIRFLIELIREEEDEGEQKLPCRERKMERERRKIKRLKIKERKRKKEKAHKSISLLYYLSLPISVFQNVLL